MDEVNNVNGDDEFSVEQRIREKISSIHDSLEQRGLLNIELPKETDADNERDNTIQ